MTFRPLAKHQKILPKGCRIKSQGTFWTRGSGPLLTGEFVGSIQDSIIDKHNVELNILVEFIEYPMTLEFMMKDLDEGAPLLVWLHFCTQAPCQNVGQGDGRIHCLDIQLVEKNYTPMHLHAAVMGKELPSPVKEPEDPGMKSLQELALRMGFPPVPPTDNKGMVMDQPETKAKSSRPPSTSVRNHKQLGEFLATQAALKTPSDLKNLSLPSTASTAPQPVAQALPDEGPEDGRVKKKKKKKKRKKHKKKEKGSDSSSESSSSSTTSSSMRDGRGKFARMSQKKPGKLFLLGYREIFRLLNEKTGMSVGGLAVETQVLPIMTKYYHMVMKTKSLGVRSEREALTLTTALDLFVGGNFPGALDVLMQRLKALEAAGDNVLPWTVASQLELVEPSRPSALSRREQETAVRLQLREQKVAKLLIQQKGDGDQLARSRSPVQAPRPSALRTTDAGEARKVTFKDTPPVDSPRDVADAKGYSTFKKNFRPWWGKGGGKKPPNK